MDRWRRDADLVVEADRAVEEIRIDVAACEAVAAEMVQCLGDQRWIGRGFGSVGGGARGEELRDVANLCERPDEIAFDRRSQGRVVADVLEGVLQQLRHSEELAVQCRRARSDAVHERGLCPASAIDRTLSRSARARAVSPAAMC